MLISNIFNIKYIKNNNKNIPVYYSLSLASFSSIGRYLSSPSLR